MSYTYTTYKTALAEMMVIEESNAEFVAILPSIIQDAEQRIYRELDLLATVVRDSSANLTANSRNFTLPQSLGRFVTVTGINVLTPVGTGVSNGTRNALVQASLDYMDFTWNTNTAASATTVPVNWAMVTDQTIVLGPPPGDVFNAEVVGTIRPTPLSESNTETYLSLYLPDLFLDASMVFASGYMRNFGSQADDPKMAASWEQQYQLHKASANAEEIRKRYGEWAARPGTPPA